MVELSLDRINAVAPYQVQLDSRTGLYKFVSDYQVGFSVAFEENDLLQSGESYQFALTNYEGKKSPRDNKVRITILAIIGEFFAKNEAALLYICETGDGMQKMRNRLFHFWFGVYAEHDEFLFLPQVVYDEEDNENYAALIIRRDNPKFNDLVTEFTNTITLLNTKPD
ncbi:DUF6169 family protein [Leyella stercorea]|uniref:DUF6169 family protein n=1 Tax=Leyella stercorea TaxID=363265 RepID=UPI00242E0FC6|nr:DUF6169 family protein [Leyella stercorea]